MLKLLFKIEKTKKDIKNIKNTIDEIELELKKINLMINK